MSHNHEIHWIAPSEITPYYRNPRKNEQAILKVAESIQTFGFNQPIIKHYTQKGGLIIDPCCGYGSTILAAERLQRKCYAIEIDPYVCDLVVERFESVTGTIAEQVEGSYG